MFYALNLYEDRKYDLGLPDLFKLIPRQLVKQQIISCNRTILSLRVTSHLQCTTTVEIVEEGVGPRRATKLCSLVVGPTRKFKYESTRYSLCFLVSFPRFSSLCTVFNIFISRCPKQLILKL